LFTRYYSDFKKEGKEQVQILKTIYSKTVISVINATPVPPFLVEHLN